jgi:hypothetical protein
MNMEGALREWFCHGEKVFEMRRDQMKLIARKSGFDSAQFDKSYDERVEDWKMKYEPQSGTVDTGSKLPVLTAEHPIFANVENLTSGIIKSVNVYADIVVPELKKMLKFRKYMLKQQKKSKQQLKNARIQVVAIECLIAWKKVRALDIWTYEDEISEMTPPDACSTETILVSRVKEVLGKPTFEEYSVFGGLGGAGDLVYISANVILVIECKRVVGRAAHFAVKVREQAIKYANVFAGMLSEKVTVYAITYTEYGFTLVDIHGEPRFPKRFEALLDSIPILH